MESQGKRTWGEAQREGPEQEARNGFGTMHLNKRGAVTLLRVFSLWQMVREGLIYCRLKRKKENRIVRYSL